MVFLEYRIIYYRNARNGRVPAKEFLEALETRRRYKVRAYIDLLRERGGYLDEPYARHISGGVRELRVDFSKHRHRIFYFTAIGKRIILLHAFYKKSPKTPSSEIARAMNNYNDFMASDEGGTNHFLTYNGL